MKNRILSFIFILVLVFSLVGCNQTSDRDNDEDNKKENNQTTISEEAETTETDTDNNTSIEFTDFLVERCVRKELDKDWDEEITMKDLEEVTSLCISSIYDPTFAIKGTGIRYNGIRFDSSSVIYYGYIDLSDLKYLKNLKELKLDTFGIYDSIVNLEAITECKELEKISMPWTNEATVCSINPLGYKFWQDIISELPKLEYLDLGQYFDEHMMEVVLDETDNKDIEIYYGNKADWYGDGVEKYHYQAYDASDIATEVALIDCYQMLQVDDYEQMWDYEYKSIAERLERIWSMNYRYRGTFPVIYTDAKKYLSDEYSPSKDEFAYATDKETLQGKLDKISNDAEDIIVVYDGEDELDFSMFERFTNLVTLSVFGSCFKEAGYYDYDTLTFVKTGGYTGLTASNLRDLSKLENLQVLNLGGFVGDISEIKEIKNLRELSIIDCAPDSTEFISELESVKELILLLHNEEDPEDFYDDLNDDVTALKNLKFYRDYNQYVPEITSLYENINDMKELETLIVVNNKFLENIVRSQNLNNLCVYGYEELDDITFEKMKGLKQVVILGGTYAMNIDYMSIVELPKIQMITYPCLISSYGGLEEIMTNELAQKIVASGNVTAFRASPLADYKKECMTKSNRQFISKLYKAGIDDGIFQSFIRSGWHYGEERTYEDFCETYGY